MIAIRTPHDLRVGLPGVARDLDRVVFFADGPGDGTGSVVLQAAQNSASYTTTIGLGSFMRATKIG